MNAEAEKKHFNFEEMDLNVEKAEEGKLVIPSVHIECQDPSGSSQSPPNIDLRPPPPRTRLPTTSSNNELSPGGSSRPPSPFLDFASAVTSLMQQVNLMVERERTQKFLG